MTTEQNFLNDSRFYVDDFTFNNHLRISKMVSYKIEKMKIGDILRYQNKRIFNIKESDVYNFLTTGNEKDYERYCMEICKGDDYYKHSPKIYKKLIDEMNNEEYDLKKGAIIVNQLNIIMDGQHRTCILLKKYGPEHMVDVVKIKYKHLGFFTYINYIKYLMLRGIKN